MTVKEMDQWLPGGPSKRLVRDVRRSLKRYGIVPVSRDDWRLTWEWANGIKHSYFWVRPRWPAVSEIVAQYVTIIFLKLARDHTKLHYRAKEKMPQALLDRCAEVAALALPLEPRPLPALEDKTAIEAEAVAVGN